jgi:hypothetical protein
VLRAFPGPTYLLDLTWKPREGPAIKGSHLTFTYSHGLGFGTSADGFDIGRAGDESDAIEERETVSEVVKGYRISNIRFATFPPADEAWDTFKKEYLDELLSNNFQLVSGTLCTTGKESETYAGRHPPQLDLETALFIERHGCYCRHVEQEPEAVLTLRTKEGDEQVPRLTEWFEGLRRQ